MSKTHSAVTQCCLCPLHVLPLMVMIPASENWQRHGCFPFSLDMPSVRELGWSYADRETVSPCPCPFKASPLFSLFEEQWDHFCIAMDTLEARNWGGIKLLWAHFSVPCVTHEHRGFQGPLRNTVYLVRGIVAWLPPILSKRGSGEGGGQWYQPKLPSKILRLSSSLSLTSACVTVASRDTARLQLLFGFWCGPHLGVAGDNIL